MAPLLQQPDKPRHPFAPRSYPSHTRLQPRGNARQSPDRIRHPTSSKPTLAPNRVGTWTIDGVMAYACKHSRGGYDEGQLRVYIRTLPIPIGPLLPFSQTSSPHLRNGKPHLGRPRKPSSSRNTSCILHTSHRELTPTREPSYGFDVAAFQLRSATDLIPLAPPRRRPRSRRRLVQARGQHVDALEPAPGLAPQETHHAVYPHRASYRRAHALRDGCRGCTSLFRIACLLP